MVIGEIIGRLHYLLLFAMAAGGIALALGASNLMRRIAGLAIAWAALALFFAAAAVQIGAAAPIVAAEAAFGRLYANPLPQALVFGVIASGAACVMLAIAIAIRIREAYGGIEGADIAVADEAEDAAERGE